MLCVMWCGKKKVANFCFVYFANMFQHSNANQICDFRQSNVPVMSAKSEISWDGNKNVFSGKINNDNNHTQTQYKCYTYYNLYRHPDNAITTSPSHYPFFSIFLCLCLSLCPVRQTLQNGKKINWNEKKSKRIINVIVINNNPKPGHYSKHITANPFKRLVSMQCHI